MSKRVSLVLGSGGARGYAHIGVIEVLTEMGFEVICVAGSSMGALVGGLYCADKLHQYRDWICSLDYLDVIGLLDVSFLTSGVIRGDKVFAVIKDMVGDTQIEELPIPYTAVATDLTRQKEVWFQRGSLLTAIRASSAIPSLFAPVTIDGRVLVDGAVLNPVPIIPTVSAHADFIIAVDASADVNEKIKLPNVLRPEQVEEREATWFSGITESITKKFGWSAEESRQETEALTQKSLSPSQRKWGKLDVMYQSIEIMQTSLTQYKIAGYPPDLLISIPSNVSRAFDFHKGPELIALGRELATKALQDFDVD